MTFPRYDNDYDYGLLLSGEDAMPTLQKVAQKALLNGFRESRCSDMGEYIDMLRKVLTWRWYTVLQFSTRKIGYKAAKMNVWCGVHRIDDGILEMKIKREVVGVDDDGNDLNFVLFDTVPVEVFDRDKNWG